MKFSIFYVHETTDGKSEKQAFDELMEQCQLADDLGFHGVWFAEHHFSKAGVMPDPLLWCAAVAQKTKNIRLGTGISIMSFHNPIRLAEQAAMVDVLSNGRVDLGIGRGSQPKEFKSFNAKPSESRRRLQEGVEIVGRLLEGEKLTYDGEFFKCNETEIYPHPVQKPRPPIWIAGTSPETYVWAGENGFKVMASAGFKGPEVFREKMALYVDAVKRSGGNTSNIDYALLHRCIVCEDLDKDKYIENFEESMSKYLTYRADINKVDFPDDESIHLQRNWSYTFSVSDLLDGGGVVGNIEDNILEIKRLQEEFGLTDILMGMYGIGATHEQKMEILERFANEVMTEVPTT